MAKNDNRVRIKSSTKEIPAATRLEDLRWEPSYTWGTDISLTKEAVKSLADCGMHTVADLDGTKLQDLTKLSGIGEVTADRLLKAAKLAKLTVVGFGWPGDIAVAIPFEVVNEARALTDSEPEAQRIVEEAATELLRNTLPGAIKGTLDEKRRQRIEALELEIQALQAELVPATNGEAPEKVWPNQG